MKTKIFGHGAAPSITWSGDRWLVAIGLRATGVEVLSLDRDLNQVSNASFHDGFGFPVVRYPWLMYKAGEVSGWRAILINLATGERIELDPAEGNTPVCLGQRHAVWQTQGGFGPFTIRIAELDNLSVRREIGPGAPDGIASVSDTGTVALIKDIRFSESGMFNPQYADGCVVGENGDGGVRVRWQGRERVLEPGTDTKTPRVAEGPDGEMGIVAWGDQGVRVLSFTLDDLGSTVPVPTPTPTIPSVRVRAFPRKVWMAPIWSHSKKYGYRSKGEHAGNAIWVGGDAADPSVFPQELEKLRHEGMPLIVSADAIPAANTHDLIVAFYLHGQSHADMQRQIERVSGPGWPVKPLIAYMDTGDTTQIPVEPPTWLTSDRIWPSFAAYRNPGEELSVFRFRCETILERVQGWGNYLCLTPAFYTRNKHPDGSPIVPVAQIVECMPLYAQWMQEFSICAVLPFADLRPSGMGEHPEFYGWARAFLDACPANRPNRFDYWTPPGGAAVSLANKLRQDIDILVLSKSERQFLLDEMDEGIDPPDEPGTGQYPPELEDQLALVTDVRNTLFPDKIGLPLHDPRKAMRMTKHVAWRLRQHGIGLVRAKEGSANNVDGYTTDVVALKNGVHWDVQVDGNEGAAFARWGLEHNPDNYPPIAKRWMPAVQPE